MKPPHGSLLSLRLAGRPAPLAALLATLLTAPAHAAEGGLKLLSITTLIGEIITFAILVWVVMKFVWPPLTNAVEKRQKEIADGLAAAERGQQSLADAAREKGDILAAARAKSGDILAEADARGVGLIDTARAEAEAEKKRILTAGRRQLESERAALQRDMQEKISALIIAGAEQILQREVNAKAHADIIAAMKKAV